MPACQNRVIARVKGERRMSDKPKLNKKKAVNRDDLHAEVVYRGFCQMKGDRYSSLLAALGKRVSGDVIDQLADRIWQNYLAADAARGIDSHFVKSSNNARITWLRDARRVKPESFQLSDVVTRIHYCSMLTNYVMALALLEKSVLGEVDNQQQLLELCDIFSQTCQKVPDVEQYFLAFLRFKIAPVMIEKNLAVNEEDAIQQLDRCKDWGAMQLPSVDIMTVDRVQSGAKSSDVVRLDTPITELTEQQRNEFECHYQQSTWFNRLSAPEKKLYTAHYKERILEQRVLPSQLRDRIPGLKNAFHSQTFVHSDTAIKKVSDFFHCGSLPFLGGDSDSGSLIASTKQTAHQQSRVSSSYYDGCSENRSHVMLTLNSVSSGDVIHLKNKIIRFFSLGSKKQKKTNDSYDKKIVEATAAVLGSNDSESMNHGNLCLNGYRYVEKRRGSAIRKNVLGGAKIALRTIKKHRKNLKQTLKGDSQLSPELSEIDQQIKLLKRSTKRLWWKSWRSLHYFKKGLFDKEVKNVQLAALAIQLSCQLDSLRERYSSIADDIPSVAVWVGCASGENRTGIAEFVSQTVAVRGELQSYDAHTIAKAMAAGHHIQVVVGSVGGSAGMVGIRSKSMDSLPKSFKKDSLGHSDNSISQMLTSKTADNKSASARIAACQKKKSPGLMTEEAMQSYVQIVTITPIVSPVDRNSSRVPVKADDSNVQRRERLLRVIGDDTADSKSVVTTKRLSTGSPKEKKITKQRHCSRLSAASPAVNVEEPLRQSCARSQMLMAVMVALLCVGGVVLCKPTLICRVLFGGAVLVGGLFRCRTKSPVTVERGSTRSYQPLQ